jgi:hypothetical protein
MSDDGNLDELLSAFKQLENKSDSGSVKGGVISHNKDGTPKLTMAKTILNKFGIYIAFFIYLVILILILQPYQLYKLNPETQKFKFLWKKFFIILFVSYAILIGLYLGIQFYLKKINK